MSKEKKMSFIRRTTCIGLTAVMAASVIVGQALAFADTSNGGLSADGASSVSFENVTGDIDLTEIKLENMDKSVVKELTSSADIPDECTVLVSLDGATLTERADGEKVADYILTRAGQQAVKDIANEQQAFLKKLDKSAISYELVDSYNAVFNGVAIKVKTAQLKTIKKLGGVSSVSVSQTYAVPDDIEEDGSIAQTNYSNIYANGIYNSTDQVKAGYDGSGMTVAILDTGLDYTHEAFTSYMPTEVAFTEEDIEDKMAAGGFMAQSLSGATAADVYVNAKVPFAYDYADKDADVYPSYSQHGTHVAGIVAGHADSYDDKDGNVAVDENDDELPFYGVAPNAQLVIAKVFTDDIYSNDIGGAVSEDIIAGLDDCVKLGVDVINMSLGQRSGFPSSTLGLDENDDEGYALQRVYGAIKEQGIELVVAASNDFSSGYGSAYGTNLASNPDSGTVGSPSTYSAAISVASVNGQSAPYLLANATVGSDGSVTGGNAIYYEESRNEDSEAYDFFADMTKGMDTSKPITFKYVVVPGTGAAGDYTANIKNELSEDDGYGKVIAVVRRGVSSFKEKIQTAMSMGADAVIVYNNVAGMIRMSLEDLQNPVPAISVSVDSGLLLTGSGSTRRTTGTITLSSSYQAGPFMNDYSSWGPGPDLQLKPEITSHGGEVTSTVAGGYDEMSGTSMASPNLAGFAAILRQYLKEDAKFATEYDGTNVGLTALTNKIIMSTATMLYDQNKLPYSPRKQGAGLATLSNAFSTSAYLYTKDEDDMIIDPEAAKDGRPKAELGADISKKGEYTIKFYVRNFGDTALTFSAASKVMTETLSADGLSVAEKAHLFENTTSWKVDGKSVAEGASFSVAAHGDAAIEVTVKLSASDKRYIDTNFENGMYVEGFMQLLSGSADQCDLVLPFLAFYGDWKAAPMLDYDCFEIAAFDADTSYTAETRPQEMVWATQAYTFFYNEKYTTGLGSFTYAQDEALEHTNQYVYTDNEHAAISGYNEYTSATDVNNYMTLTGINSLYAGLLRNAEVVTYTLTNVDTGEIIPDDDGNLVRESYRIGKAAAAGGAPSPSVVELDMRTLEMDLDANGKYELKFNFYFDYDDYKAGTPVPDENTFTMSFYVDYEAPVLVDSRVRFRDYKDGANKVKQQVYLDLDVYDNHYPQAVILCYSEDSEISADETLEIKLATEYVTPVLNPKKNSVTTVSIDITDIYEEYGDKLYVELDDYAMNHNVYALNLGSSATSSAPSSFAITDDTGAEAEEVTISVNQAMQLGVTNLGNSHINNLQWRSDSQRIVQVKNGQIFGVSEGRTRVTAIGADSSRDYIYVNVVGDSTPPRLSSVSFGTIINGLDNPQKAQGTIEVNPGQQFKLNILSDPWYYDLSGTAFTWSTTDDSVASVDQNGNVTVHENEDPKTVTITATCVDSPSISAVVTLRVNEPYTILNGTLTAYNGWGGELVEDFGGIEGNDRMVLTIPADKAIMSIGEEAFRDNKNVEVIIIPKGVTTIGERAFWGCTNLKEIYFVDTEKLPVKESSLTQISTDAFMGCVNLEKVDFTNCKVFTVARTAFANCTSLKQVVNMGAIGTMLEGAFYGCTSLQSADISLLHVAEGNLFTGCTSLESVTTSATTAMGENMFRGCTSLRQVTINNPVIPSGAFYGCTSLESVTFGAQGTDTAFSVGANAFNGCTKLASVTFNGGIKLLGDNAFANCPALKTLVLPEGGASFGGNVFGGQNVHVSGGNYTVENGALYDGNTLVLAPATVGADFAFKAGTTAIGPYAFAGSTLANGATLDLSGITTIGEGAFRGLSGLTSVTLSGELTEIAPYAFYGTGITSVTIPANVTKIGSYAFAESSLRSVEFANGNKLTQIGSYAFRRSQLTQIALPDGVTEIGDMAFANCASLTRADISSVTKMGEGVFSSCSRLAIVTFGENATTTGTYTFQSYTVSGTTITGNSALTSVTLSDKITEIGEGTFAYCNVLTGIDLRNVTVIGANAFANCFALRNIDLGGVKEVGQAAFAYCTQLTSADLSSATAIYAEAFVNDTKLASVTFGTALEGIGDYAFYSTAIGSTVTIPATCEYVGASAFNYITNLSAIEVAAGNANYFAENGVLYRYIDEDSYELVTYPHAKSVPADSSSQRIFSIKEGTAAIEAFAFAYVPSTSVTAVVLPWTVKTIGDGAFYGSGITRYRFESMSAPVLLEGYSDRDTTRYSAGSFFYTNFVQGIVSFVPYQPHTSASQVSPLVLNYPENGTGYDSYIYTMYFGTKVSIGEMPTDNARNFKSTVEGFPAAEEVSGWNADNHTKAQVEEFAAQVQQAHRQYNTLNTDYQLDFVGSEIIDKFFAVESALRPVKTAFGITVRVTTVTVDSSSTYKSEYTQGEKFDLSGLKLVLTYDDYSQETIDAQGSFVLASGYDGELQTYHQLVSLDGTGMYEGLFVNVPVHVTAAQQTPPPEGDGGQTPPEGGDGEQTPPETNGGCGGCSGEGYGTAAIVISALAAAAAALAIRLVRRSAESEGDDNN